MTEIKNQQIDFSDQDLDEMENINEEDSFEDNLWFRRSKLPDNYKTVKGKLVFICVLCFTFIIIESIGAFISKSIAILTDAIHLFSDLFGFMLSLLAVYLSQKKSTNKKTYGYVRAEIIGALLSVLIIWVMTVYIFSEAIQRFITISNGKSIELNPLIMFITSLIGLFVNITMAFSLHSHGHGHGHHHGHSHSHGHNHKHDHEHEHHHKHDHEHEHHHKHDHEHEHSHEDDHDHNHDHHEHEDHHNQNFLTVDEPLIEKKKKLNLSMVDANENQNIKAAFAHILGDLVQSIGVVIVSLVIYLKPEWEILDPILSIVFTVLAVSFSIPVIKDIMKVLLDSAPDELDIEQFEKDLLSIPNVVEVHDLHVWNMTFGKPNLTCHLKCKSSQQNVLKKATVLCRKIGIYHSTIQVELLSPKRQNSINCDHNLHQQLKFNIQ